MKVKKFNETTTSNKWNKEHLEKFRNEKFNSEREEFILLGEKLDYFTPQYNRLYSGNLKNCINFYNENNQPDIISIYDNIILIKETAKSELLDLKTILDSNKFNL